MIRTCTIAQVVNHRRGDTFAKKKRRELKLSNSTKAKVLLKRHIKRPNIWLKRIYEVVWNLSSACMSEGLNFEQCLHWWAVRKRVNYGHHTTNNDVAVLFRLSCEAPVETSRFSINFSQKTRFEIEIYLYCFMDTAVKAFPLNQT